MPILNIYFAINFFRNASETKKIPYKNLFKYSKILFLKSNIMSEMELLEFY